MKNIQRESKPKQRFAIRLNVSIGLLLLTACHANTFGTSLSDAGDGEATQDTIAVSDAKPMDANKADSPSSEVSVPEGWMAIPGGEYCGLYVADMNKVSFPARVWEPCGTGCFVASAGLPGHSAADQNPSATELNGEIYVRTQTNFLREEKIVDLMWITRLSDGATLAAIEQRAHWGHCVGGRAEGSAFMIPFSGFPSPPINENEMLMFPLFIEPKLNGKVTWFPQFIKVDPVPNTNFIFESGMGFAGLDGTIQLKTSMDSSPFQVIDSGSTTSRSMGRGDLAVWSAYTSSAPFEIIKGYRKAWGIPAVLVKNDMYNHGLALSDEKLAWVGTKGPNAVTGTYEFASFYWSPNPKNPADIVINKGATIPAEVGLLQAQTSGDYAAVFGCITKTNPRRCGVFVTRFSTGKLWFVPARASKMILSVLAVSPTEILVAERDQVSTAQTGMIERLVRLKIEHLDAMHVAP